MITDEKRAFKRSIHRFTVKYRTLKNINPKSGMSTSENISLGGVYFLSIDSFDIGEAVECSISTSVSSKTMQWISRVVRCEKINKKMINTFGVAVEFVRTFKNSDNELKKILKMRTASITFAKD